MKKLLLSLACIASFCSANAFELSFWLGDQKIAPGQTVTFSDITVNDSEGYLEVAMKPELYLMSDTYTGDVKITATCTSGQSIGLCAGGQCIGGEKVVKNDVIIGTDEKLNLGFDYIGEFDLDEEIPVVETLFEAEDVTVKNSKVQFVIQMGKDLAGVTAIELNDDLLPVDGGIAYKADAECELTLTNLAGVCVFSSNVYGEGIVDLSHGLYVYRFGDRTGKIYVK